MAINTASNFSADVSAYIEKKLLPLARRQLVAYQFGEPIKLPFGRGTTYTATRYNRIPLPFQSLSEGVPPPSESLSINQVTVSVVQWGDRVTITDIAELTIEHPLFKTATELMGLQTAETLERNTFNVLMTGTQLNTVNSRGSRGAILSTDTLNVTEINRAVAMLHNIGAPRFMGDEQTDIKVNPRAGEPKAGGDPRSNPHYVAIIHPFVEMDLRSFATIVTAWSYSDINKLYNDELGEWGGLRFCRSNMVPSFTGTGTQATGTPSTGASGALATNSYFIKITGSDTQNQYESQIGIASASISVTGPNGLITTTTPNVAGFTYNVYIGTTSSPTNLAAAVALPGNGIPTQGPLTGQAVQIPANTTVTLTAIGTGQTPPAAPGNGITIYPNFIFGRGSYGIVTLDQVRVSFLTNPDKSDPLNQLRVLGWKVLYGTIVLNQTFMLRVESASAFNPTFA